MIKISMFGTLKNPRILIAFVHDAMVSAFAFLLAIGLRYETFNPFSTPVQNLETIFLISLVVQMVCFYLAGLYKGIWRFSSTPDLIRVLKGSTIGVVSSLVAILLYNRLASVPRSAFVIDWVLLILGLGGGRFVFRVWKDLSQSKSVLPESIENILIVGAGNAGVQLAKEINSNPQFGLHIVGFIDDDPLRKNRSIIGIEILGSKYEISHFVSVHNVKKIFIALPSASGAEIREIVHQCEESGVQFKTLPKLNDILSDKIELSLLRNVKFEDLLGRKPVQLDKESVERMVTGRTILITGAGGSIGSELCRQVANLRPRQLICFEISEPFLYELEMELRNIFPLLKIIPIIGDVRHRSKIASVFKQYKPDVVLHAAAYKHVPMMELNPMEAIFTNVLGTQNVAEMAQEYAVKKFVMISTDKAVNPTNVMGCSKRIAEMICQKLGNQNSSTEFITVRFGNVLGSNGSVIPLFKKQIENQRDVTVTHPDIERYFMSIPEASQLVLQAATMGVGGEIFVLDMGEPIKIVDLAKEMISLAGLELGRDIEIKYTGLRPGEKLYEELFAHEEELVQTTHSKVRIAKNRELIKDFDEKVSILIGMDPDTVKEDVIKNMKALVKEFDHLSYEEPAEEEKGDAPSENKVH